MCQRMSRIQFRRNLHHESEDGHLFYSVEILTMSQMMDQLFYPVEISNMSQRMVNHSILNHELEDGDPFYPVEILF